MESGRMPRMPHDRMRLAFILACAVTSPAGAQIVRGGALPAPLPIHPANHWWNVDISAAPIDTNSTNFINHHGATTGAPDTVTPVAPCSTGSSATC